MKLYGAMIVRNEAGPDRFLRDVLLNMGQWCDRIIVLDDNSTDDTVAICRDAGCFVVLRESTTPMWGHEAPARKELWDIAASNANDHQAWLLFQDADQMLSKNPRPLLASEHVNTWCFGLRDMWNETQYRVDGAWAMGKLPRPWLVHPGRVPEGWTPEWNDRGLHAGHLPSNWPGRMATAPSSYYWEHWSYSTPELRQRKHDQYLEHRDQLTDFEIAHATSILDPLPELSVS